jgi:hypothetical protein
MLIDVALAEWMEPYECLLFSKFRMRIGFEPISFFQSIVLMDYIEN